MKQLASWMIEEISDCLTKVGIFSFVQGVAERQTSAGVTYKIHRGCWVITQTLSQHFSIKALLSMAKWNQHHGRLPSALQEDTKTQSCRHQIFSP